MIFEDPDVLAQQRPDARKIGNIDCDRSFACIPQHVRCTVNVGQVIHLSQDSGDDLGVMSVKGALGYGKDDHLQRKYPC